jgi:excisionase family DNA binding protein
MTKPTTTAAPTLAGIPDRPMLTIQEVATILGVNHKTVRAACAAGHLPCFKIGRVLRIPRAVIASMTEQGRVVPP